MIMVVVVVVGKMKGKERKGKDRVGKERIG